MGSGKYGSTGIAINDLEDEYAKQGWSVKPAAIGRLGRGGLD